MISSQLTNFGVKNRWYSVKIQGSAERKDYCFKHLSIFYQNWLYVFLPLKHELLREMNCIFHGGYKNHLGQCCLTVMLNKHSLKNKNEVFIEDLLLNCEE